MVALDVLVVIPSPSDVVPFDADRAWHDLSQALQLLVAQGALRLERLHTPSENALRERLAQAPCTVLHFIGSGSSRSAAQYGTLTFEGSSGRSRGVNANHLAALLKQHEELQLTILQASQAGDDPLGAIADTLVIGGVPAVVSAPRFDNGAFSCFVREFYGALVSERTGEHAIQCARDALVHYGKSASVLRLRARVPDWRISRAGASQAIASSVTTVPSQAAREPIAAAPEPLGHAAQEQRDRSAGEQRVAQGIAHKRAVGEFDIFLCHNWADKPAVKKIAHQLMSAGILPWLDEWELPPGRPWQPLLEQQIVNIKTAGVFVGAAGIGPWQEQELNGFLRQFVKRASPVIPVLLQNAPDQPALPIFLEAMTWVDFRLIEPDPLQRLIWGITGKRVMQL